MIDRETAARFLRELRAFHVARADELRADLVRVLVEGHEGDERALLQAVSVHELTAASVAMGLDALLAQSPT